MKTLEKVFNIFLGLFCVFCGVALLITVFFKPKKPNFGSWEMESEITDAIKMEFIGARGYPQNFYLWWEEQKKDNEYLTLEWEKNLVKKYGLKPAILEFDEEKLRQAGNE